MRDLLLTAMLAGGVLSLAVSLSPLAGYAPAFSVFGRAVAVGLAVYAAASTDFSTIMRILSGAFALSCIVVSGIVGAEWVSGLVAVTLSGMLVLYRMQRTLFWWVVAAMGIFVVVRADSVVDRIYRPNFYAGGQNFRGFENRVIGPRAVYRYVNAIPGLPDPFNGTSTGGLPNSAKYDTYQVSRRSFGGNAMAIGTLELITPTPFLKEDYANSVRTSLFVDAGNVWDTEFDINRYTGLTQALDSSYYQPGLLDYSDAGMMRASAGLTVQWISPMGPLTFSLAKILRKYEGDEQENFSFNIGTTF